MPRALVVTPNIHWKLIDESVVMLDEISRRYFALDREDSQIWCQYLSQTPPPGGTTPSSSHPAIINAAIDRKWLIDPKSSYAKPECLRREYRTWRNFYAMHAAACLFNVAYNLKCFGFQKSYEAARAINCSTSASIDLATASKAFLFAERFFTTRKASEDCLGRSLALYSFLTRCGFAVTHHIGIQRYPFLAHAWVESNAVPVLDMIDKVEVYTPIASLNPVWGTAE